MISRIVGLLFMTMVLISGSTTALAIDDMEISEVNSMNVDFWDRFPRIGGYLSEESPFIQMIPMVISSENNSSTIRIYMRNIGSVPFRLEAMVISCSGGELPGIETGWIQSSNDQKTFYKAISFDPFTLQVMDDITLLINMQINNSDDYHLILDGLIIGNYDVFNHQTVIFQF